MKDTDKTNQESDGQEGSSDELLGDLESIKQLLDEEDQRQDDAADPAAPLLDDMIDGAYELRETSFLSVTPALGGGQPNRKNKQLNEDLFDALLGDDWKSSAADILTGARGAIEAHRNDWTPEDTDDLNEALRVSIDETLSVWLRETVRNRMDELRAELLIAAESAINDKINALVKQQISADEGVRQVTKDDSGDDAAEDAAEAAAEDSGDAAPNG